MMAALARVGTDVRAYSIPASRSASSPSGSCGRGVRCRGRHRGVVRSLVGWRFGAGQPSRAGPRPIRPHRRGLGGGSISSPRVGGGVDSEPGRQYTLRANRAGGDVDGRHGRIAEGRWHSASGQRATAGSTGRVLGFGTAGVEAEGAAGWRSSDSERDGGGRTRGSPGRSRRRAFAGCQSSAGGQSAGAKDRSGAGPCGPNCSGHRAG